MSTLTQRALACAVAMLAAGPAIAQTKTVNTVQTPARTAVNGAPSILIPPSSVGIDLCLGEASGAYASPMIAVTLSGPRRDRDCTALRLSKWASDLQHPALAYQIGCAARVWREADAVTDRLCIAPLRPWWRFWQWKACSPARFWSSPGCTASCTSEPGSG